MRILILTWRDLAHSAAGGAEVYTEQVARRWVDAGHEVTLFASTVPDRPADENVDGYNVVRRGGRLTVYRAARRWYRENGQGQFDVVIDMVNTVPFKAHEWITDTPVIAFFHQTAEECWHYNASLPVAMLGRYVLEPQWIRAYRGRRVMVVSQSTADALARFGVMDTVILPEGFEPVPVPDVDKESAPTVAWMARLVPYKRPQDMVEAARIAREQVPDLKVWIMGGGPMLEELRKDAPEGVEILGRVSEEEKIDRMARAHVHVATSAREGWGLVVSEAAALGTPTIAYNTPGLKDSTLAAEGQLCPPEPAALAAFLVDALPRLQQNPVAPLPYGGAHSWDEVAFEMERAVTSFLGGSGALVPRPADASFHETAAARHGAPALVGAV
jgi:glycosyltransferase involved in cell wall biosynthesis